MTAANLRRPLAIVALFLLGFFYLGSIVYLKHASVPYVDRLPAATSDAPK